MFADIVPEQLRSTVYAFDRSFEGAVAACAAPLVGKLLGMMLPLKDRLKGCTCIGCPCCM